MTFFIVRTASRMNLRGVPQVAFRKRPFFVCLKCLLVLHQKICFECQPKSLGVTKRVLGFCSSNNNGFWILKLSGDKLCIDFDTQFCHQSADNTVLIAHCAMHSARHQFFCMHGPKISTTWRSIAGASSMFSAQGFVPDVGLSLAQAWECIKKYCHQGNISQFTPQGSGSVLDKIPVHHVNQCNPVASE